jgi:predicted nucleic acid-binding protein
VILADTSVWITHFRQSDRRLVTLLNRGDVVMHPFVLGELAMGNLAPRQVILATLGHLPAAATATDEEVLAFLAGQRLFGQGIGYIDAHLLAAVKLAPVTRLWTFDKRLDAAAAWLNLDWRGWVGAWKRPAKSHGWRPSPA